MKHLIFTFIFVGAAFASEAQVPDSSRARTTPPRDYQTDSVKRGNEVYNPPKARKNKSNGDTLAQPRSNSKADGMRHKQPNKQSR